MVKSSEAEDQEGESGTLVVRFGVLPKVIYPYCTFICHHHVCVNAILVGYDHTWTFTKHLNRFPHLQTIMERTLIFLESGLPMLECLLFSKKKIHKTLPEALIP